MAGVSELRGGRAAFLFSNVMTFQRLFLSLALQFSIHNVTRQDSLLDSNAGPVSQ